MNKTGNLNYFKKFIKRLKKEINLLYKLKSQTNKDVNFLDNYYLLVKELALVLKKIPDCKIKTDINTNHPRYFHQLEREIDNFKFNFEKQEREKVIVDLVELIQENKKLQNAELNLTEILLKVIFVRRVIQKLKQEQDITEDILAIYWLNDVDFLKVVEQTSVIDKMFHSYDDGCYGNLTSRSKASYRSAVEYIAMKKQQDEKHVVKNIVARAKHAKDISKKNIGFYLDCRSKPQADLLIASYYIVPLLLSLVISLIFNRIYLIPILYLPLWEVARPIIEYIFGKFAKSPLVCEFKKDNKLVKDSNVLVIRTDLITQKDNPEKIARKIEQLSFSDLNKNIKYCLLADFPASGEKVTEDEHNLLNELKIYFKAMNKKYGDRFYLIVRDKVFSEKQNCYCGRERKRGAIEDVVKYIKDGNVDFLCFEGDKDAIKNTSYILTLDKDTKMMIDTPTSLVQFAIHPLNKAVVKNGRIISGFGIFTPRIETDLKSANKNSFSRIMSGGGGIPTYNNSGFSLYSSVFGTNIFSGKGLIDVNAYYEVLDDYFSSDGILSHDIIEGSFLKCSYVPFCVMLDETPVAVTSFYKRLNRWIRGDWQNIGFLFNHTNLIKSGDKNYLDKVDRFRIFDNIRRSLNPLIFAILLVVSLFTNRYISSILSLTTLVCFSFPYIYSGFYTLFNGNFSVLTRKYYSNVLNSLFLTFSKWLYELAFLPENAWISLSAISVSLYRMIISKKNLLAWQTAFQVDSKSDVLKSFFKILPPLSCMIFGIVFTFFVPYAFLRIFGLLFLSTFIIASYSQRMIKSINKSHLLSKSQKEKLLADAKQMWAFYVSNFSKVDNYLPVDNVQFLPDKKVAHRTSPTNIGFLLLSIMSSSDLGIINNEDAVTMAEKTISTIEKLEKYKGNLFNWYDTKTLDVLDRSYLSSVDSGNFVCSLVILKQALIEKNAEIDFINRVDKLIEETDIFLFYNENKKLFSIGFDFENKKLNNSYYDLLMSESRMTGYFAIAKRYVSLEHWYKLSRMLSKNDSYTGSVSWSGTMFEYFMPQLYMPLFKDSLIYEALEFCVYCQKRRTKDKKIPYGISESAYYAFDNSLNYQYKAHGVSQLALKRGMDKELVVSPYSTYLTINLATHDAIKNLDLLDKIGARGEMGFYEAIDFTEERIASKTGKIIKSYMAHHVGMSMMSVVNLLCDNIMQKRFFSDNYMKSAELLLQEKPLADAPVFERAYISMRREKQMSNDEVNSELYDNIYPQYPRVNILSNNEFSSVLTDSGSGYQAFGYYDVTRRPTDLLTNPLGIFAILKSQITTLSTTKAPFFDKDAEYTTEFTNKEVVYNAKKSHIDSQVKISALSNCDCEIRQINIKNSSSKVSEIELIIYAEPVLSMKQDDIAHKQFSKLFVVSEYDSKNKVLTFYRKKRDLSTSFFFSVGFLENVDFSFETSEINILKRPYGVESLKDIDSTLFTNKEKGIISCLCISAKLNVEKKTKKQLHFITSIGLSKNLATQNILRLREKGTVEEHEIATNNLFDEDISSRLAFQILPKILFDKNDGNKLLDARKANVLDKKCLWGMSISGDLPIIAFEMLNENDGARLEYYFEILKLMRRYNILFDLVILFNEQDDYYKPIFNVIIEVAKNCGCEDLYNTKSGFYVVNAQTRTPEEIILIKASACHIASDSVFKISFPQYDFDKLVINKSEAIDINSETKLNTAFGYFSDDKFIVENNPARPFCNIVANKTFGTILSDKSIGFTYGINSGENKITKWYNDISDDNKGERLIVKCDEKLFDIINGSKAVFGPCRAEYHSKIDLKSFGDNDKENVKIEFKTSVNVPDKGNLKYIDVEVKNTSNEPVEIEVAYYLELLMGTRIDEIKGLKTQFFNNTLIAVNPFSSGYKGFVAINVSEDNSHLISSKTKFFLGKWDEDSTLPKYNGCSAIISLIKLDPNQVKKTRYIFSYAFDKESAVKLLETPIKYEDLTQVYQNKISIKTPDEYLNKMINTWLPWQCYGARYVARAGFYQVSGAWGFRDQLQDSLCFMLFKPQDAKIQILRAAAHQFIEGDVLHWWHQNPKHAGGIKGVRTRYSDDLLWLAYVTCEYVEKMGDKDILDTKIHFVDGQQLADNQSEIYMDIAICQEKASLFEHCKRAIERSFKFGKHNLPLIGSGDWNDGFNKIGSLDEGESVWLAEFLIIILNKFSVFCDDETQKKYMKVAEELKVAIDEFCWDGAWYKRAFFPSGESLGSAGNEECEIDSLSQSFAAICDMPNKQRVNTALTSVLEKLVDYKHGIIKLFSPPFNGKGMNPGYISSYPQGVRENGGQYTHAAIWVCLALYMTGRCEEAYSLVKMLNPALKNIDLSNAKNYGLEPYYIAADIYTNESTYGRGGWSIYTGAAGWYYKVLVEWLIGIKFCGDYIEIIPQIPSDWNEFSFDLIIKETHIFGSVVRKGEYTVFVNGIKQNKIDLDKSDKKIEIFI